MSRLKKIIEESDTPAGRRFDLAVQCVIALSLVTFSIDTLPDLSPAFRQSLHYVEIASVLFFTIEYIARLWVTDNRTSFITSFFGIVDLLAILPFYLSVGFDFRAIRIVRLIRIFRILKLARYGRALRRFHRAIIIAREELVLFSVITSILLYLAAVGIYYFENEAQPKAFASIFHSLWWAVITLTTVGYGDVYPVTVGGRVFTFIVLMVGLGIVAIPTGIVASALAEARKPESDSGQ